MLTVMVVVLVVVLVVLVVMVMVVVEEVTSAHEAFGLAGGPRASTEFLSDTECSVPARQPKTPDRRDPTTCKPRLQGAT